MSDALTPTQALAYVCELNPAATAARMLDRGGVTLAQRGAAVTSATPGVVGVRDEERELIVALSAEGAAMAELVRMDATVALAAVRWPC